MNVSTCIHFCTLLVVALLGDYCLEQHLDNVMNFVVWLWIKAEIIYTLRRGINSSFKIRLLWKCYVGCTGSITGLYIALWHTMYILWLYQCAYYMHLSQNMAWHWEKWYLHHSRCRAPLNDSRNDETFGRELQKLYAQCNANFNPVGATGQLDCHRKYGDTSPWAYMIFETTKCQAQL